MTHYDETVDVFSFGVMMAEVIGVRRPYDSIGLDHFKLTEFIIQGGVRRQKKCSLLSH